MNEQILNGGCGGKRPSEESRGCAGMLILELRIAKASFGGLPMRTQPQQTAHPCAFAAAPGIRARDLLGIQRCLSTSKLRHNASLRTPGSPLTGFSRPLRIFPASIYV